MKIGKKWRLCEQLLKMHKLEMFANTYLDCTLSFYTGKLIKSFNGSLKYKQHEVFGPVYKRVCVRVCLSFAKTYFS